MKISNLLIAIVLVGLFVTVLGSWIADLNSNYGSEIDETNLEIFNKLDSINTQTEQIQDKVDNLKEKTGALDILGGLLSDGYSALKITAQSFDLMDSIINAGVKYLKLPAIFKVAMSAIVLIIIFISIILSAILKDNNKL